MQQNKELVLQGGHLLTRHGFLSATTVIVKDGKIKNILPAATNYKPSSKAEVIKLSSSSYLLPGFIDMHVHGAGGSDVMDGDQEALKTMSAALAKEGTTSFLATTSVLSVDKIEKALVNAAKYRQSYSKKSAFSGAELLGVYMEGPFLSKNKEKVGALNPEHMLAPDVKLLAKWLHMVPDIIKVVGVAPELRGSLELIKFIKRQNLVATIGHSVANFADAERAIKAGADHTIHLFNAMPSIHHREPGLVMAALLSDQVSAELIVDNVHLHPAMVEFVVRNKNLNKIILITDGIRAKGLKDGKYDLGGLEVTVKNGEARLDDGRLAGSTLAMNVAVRNTLEICLNNREHSGEPIVDANNVWSAIAKNYVDNVVKAQVFSDVVNMATINPARKIGVAQTKGSIEVGKDADLVVLDSKFKVLKTIVRGDVVFAR